VWHSPGRGPLASDYQGREATFAYFGRVAQDSGGTFRAEPSHVAAVEDVVVGVQRNTAERDGRRLYVGDCIVFRLEAGRVVEAWEHFDDLYAWDEFWS